MDDPKRKHIRLRGFDYRSNVAYFVTICTRDRREVFGSIVGDECRPSRRGLVAAKCWADLPSHHSHVELDASVVMPNHVHGILRFVGATPASPGSSTLPGYSLGAVLGSYKSAVSRTINRRRPGSAADLWQRGYYDHVIRHDHAYAAIWQYIGDNPRRWHEDEENPRAVSPVGTVRWLEAVSAVPGDAGVAPTKIESR